MEIYFHPFVNIAHLGRITKECQETFWLRFYRRSLPSTRSAQRLSKSTQLTTNENVNIAATIMLILNTNSTINLLIFWSYSTMATPCIVIHFNTFKISFCIAMLFNIKPETKIQIFNNRNLVQRYKYALNK